MNKQQRYALTAQGKAARATANANRKAKRDAERAARPARVPKAKPVKLGKKAQAKADRYAEVLAAKWEGTANERRIVDAIRQERAEAERAAKLATRVMVEGPEGPEPLLRYTDSPEKELELLIKISQREPWEANMEYTPAELHDALIFIRKNQRAMLANEEYKAEQYRKVTSLPRQIDANRKAAEKAEQEARDAEARKRVDSTWPDAERENAELLERIEQKKAEDAEREKRRTLVSEQFKSDSEAWAADRELSGEEKAKRKEAARVSHMRVVIDQVNLIMSDADALCDRLKTVHKLKPNDAEMKELRKALREAGVRLNEKSQSV